MLTPSAFNFIAEIELPKKSVLTEMLAQVSDAPDSNPYFHFSSLSLIHFGRFVVLDEVTEGGQLRYPAYLAFSTNHDGSTRAHLEEIVHHNPTGIDSIFSCCEGYPEGEKSIEQRIEFLLQKSDFRPYFYRGTWGRTVKQIHHEEACRKEAEEEIDLASTKAKPATEFRKRIIGRIQADAAFETFPEVETPTIGWKHILPLLLVVIATFVLIIPFLIILRIHEAFDKQIEKKASRQARTQQLAEQEDFGIQNQLTHLVEVRRGWFRLLTIKFVLHGIDWLAKYYYNQGKLGGIPSIHFARWILIDKGKRLLFFSNFDGSWESYLGDFVDRSAIGLTGVWSNTKGFPFTRFLLFKGARDEQRFKSWTREQQIFTNVWYSAYPDLTVENIRNNTEIHQGISSENLAPQEIELWLSKY